MFKDIKWKKFKRKIHLLLLTQIAEINCKKLNKINSKINVTEDKQ